MGGTAAGSGQWHEWLCPCPQSPAHPQDGISRWKGAPRAVLVPALPSSHHGTAKAAPQVLHKIKVVVKTGVLRLPGQPRTLLCSATTSSPSPGSVSELPGWDREGQSSQGDTSQGWFMPRRTGGEVRAQQSWGSHKPQTLLLCSQPAASDPPALRNSFSWYLGLHFPCCRCTMFNTFPNFMRSHHSRQEGPQIILVLPKKISVLINSSW